MASNRFPKLASQYQHLENELLQDLERGRNLKITLGFKRTGFETDPYLCPLKRRRKMMRVGNKGEIM
jgi:hypothetical protein